MPCNLASWPFALLACWLVAGTLGASPCFAISSAVSEKHLVSFETVETPYVGFLPRLLDARQKMAVSVNDQGNFQHSMLSGRSIILRDRLHSSTLPSSSGAPALNGLQKIASTLWFSVRIHTSLFHALVHHPVTVV